MLTSSLPLSFQHVQVLLSRFTQSSRALRLYTPLGADGLLAEPALVSLKKMIEHAKEKLK